MIQGIDSSDMLSQITYLANNLNQYVAGNTYNGVTITVTGTNWTTTRGVFHPKLLKDGTWRMAFNIQGGISVGAANLTLTIAGVTFKSGAGAQSICFWQNSSANIAVGLVNAGASTLTVYSNFNFSSNLGISGDVELDSKPTWIDF